MIVLRATPLYSFESSPFQTNLAASYSYSVAFEFAATEMKMLAAAGFRRRKARWSLSCSAGSRSFDSNCSSAPHWPQESAEHSHDPIAKYHLCIQSTA